MGLPEVPIPSATVNVGGVDVSVRGLSRAEVLRAFNDLGEGPRLVSEAYVLACGTNVTQAEAEAWLGTVDMATAALITDRILALSGLGDDIEGREADPKA